MKIRTSLRITTVLVLLMMVGSLAGLGLTLRWLGEATAFEGYLVDLQSDVFDRTQLRDDYLLMDRPQALLRWVEKTEEVERELKGLSRKALSPSGAALLDRMNRKFQATKVLLPRIAALKASMAGDEATREGVRLIERRLNSQLLVEAYLLSNSTKLLLLEARASTIRERNQLLVLLVLSTLALGLAVTGATAYLNRLMSQRVVALKAGADALSGGQLDHRIPVGGDDELAELTREVNVMAEKLQSSYVQLEATNRELEAFSYSVSHDLRAPLRHLTGFSELLAKTECAGADEKSRHYLEVISSSAKNMGCLIDDLLAFSRMGRAEMMLRRVELGALVAEVIRDLTRDLPSEPHIQWQVGVLPAVTGDRAMLRLVLVNLISNALKFTGKVAQPVIEVGVKPLENNCQAIYVRDNGAGFDMKYADKLFGLFQRLHASDQFDGTGVGLANVRRIVTRHGGRTWAEGELGKGATFYFTLPLQKET
jgi:signal transduction histidine kinase